MMTRYRVDATHANSFTTYQAMGSPLAPDNAQYAALKAAAQLTPDTPVAVQNGSLTFGLPRQGVTLLIISPASE